MGAEAVPWIYVNVYCCNGSVLHVVQIGCSKVWCQELFVWACCSHVSKAIIMMVVCTGTMKINFFAKDLQALAGGTGII